MSAIGRYIHAARKKGYSYEKIVQGLKESGWSEEDIRDELEDFGHIPRETAISLVIAILGIFVIFISLGLREKNIQGPVLKGNILADLSENGIYYLVMALGIIAVLSVAGWVIYSVLTKRYAK